MRCGSYRVIGDNDQVATVIQAWEIQDVQYDCDKLAELYSLQLQDLKFPMMNQALVYEMVAVNDLGL